MSWVSAVSAATEGSVVPIDGKTLRRSFDRARGKKAIHMVNAWSSANGVVLGQLKTDEKSNEITAIPQLLALLELKGCIVTIDAMGCQKEIAKQILAQGGDYLLAVKGNQGALEEAVVDFFATAQAADFKGVPVDYHETIDKGHGRIEVRRCWTSSDLSTLPHPEQWVGLSSIVMMESERHIGDQQSLDRRYYITSLPCDAQRAGHIARSHWTLDVTFREDECRVRRGEAAKNLCTLRHFVLNLLKQETTLKKSIKQKRLRAGWDDAYRAKVLFAQ
jgi:predicted transposase YbfD/YdcC